MRLHDVHFQYADASASALRGVSLAVTQGEMVVVMGASGAGKSTLIKCLNRVIPAFQPGELRGEVSLFGRILTQERVGELAGTVGMVFQDFEAQLFSTTVRDEIIFGMEQIGVEPQEMSRRLTQVLGQVGLEGFAGRDPTTLSGGEKQRLAIAALLALRPQILILDEPTTDLDPQGRQEVFELLGRMRGEGYTLVVVEHELAAAEKADRVVLLHAGEIVAEGSPQILLPQVHTLRRYGVRPGDLDCLFAHMGIATYPRGVAQAAAFLKEQGLVPSVEKFSALRDRELRQRPPFLQLQGVSYAYPDGARALENVNLTIYEGEFIALLGENGSGKTTLAKHLSGLLFPTVGKVLLRGEEISRIPLHLLAQKVNYVFQNPDHQLFASTVEEEVAFGPRNIGLSAHEIEERVAEALAAVGLEEVREQDPFLLGKGERQRLAVASLLALHPHLLILDEPTTGLDYQEQRHMMDLLKNLHQQGRTVVIITHVPWVAAQYAKRAILMARGRILWDGALRELFAQEELLARSSFRPPDITALGRHFGTTPLSVEEFLWCLGLWVDPENSPFWSH